MTSQRNRRGHLATRRALIAAGLGGLAAAFVPSGLRALAGMPGEPAQPCDTNDTKCAARKNARKDADDARQELDLGDAEAAANEFERAREHWEKAIDIGFSTGSQASIIAQKRIQMYTLTSSFSDRTLQALEGAMNGPLINIVAMQQALCALGYYQGPLDGKITDIMRSAIRKYQRDMAFDETDELPPRQVAFLIANGAETARDEASQTTLALMYASGVGVMQNRQFSLAWLRTASTRGYGPASLYLALLTGTGYCGFPLMQDHASQYLQEACQQKQPLAVELVRRYGLIPSQSTRWIKIWNDAGTQKCLSIIGNCQVPQGKS